MTNLNNLKKHFNSLIDLLGGSAIGGMTTLTSIDYTASHKD